MSTLKTTNLQHASAGSPAIVLASSGSATAQLSSINDGPIAGARNRIINGDMRIDQRNAGASVSVSSAATYTIDRWYMAFGGANGTAQRVAGTGGHPYALRLTGAAGVTSGYVGQKIEAENIADLASTTVTFTARLSSSSITSLPWYARHPNTKDNYAGVTLIDSGTVSITSTPTNYSWQISLPAGAANGFELYFDFGAFTSGTLDITGVQLEPGSVATPFERRSYGQELALCQRYFATIGDGANGYSVLATGRFNTSTAFQCLFNLPCTMRALPSATLQSATYALYEGVNNRSVGAVTTFSAGGNGVFAEVATSSATAGAFGLLQGGAASPNKPIVLFSAEL